METTKQDKRRDRSAQPIPQIADKLLADIAGTVFVLGNDFRPLWSSTHDGYLLGRHISAWEPGTLSESVHPGDQVWLKRKRHEILAAPEASVQGHLRIRDENGDYSNVSLTATNRFDDPDICGLVVTIVPAAEQLSGSSAKEQVQRAHAAKRQGELLGEIRSQIQTSLSSISDSTAALSIAGLADQVKDVHISVINSAAQELTALLDDIVDLSKVSAGTMELDSVVFSPERLLGDVVAAFEPVCIQKDIDLKLQLRTDVPSKVRGDPARLEQVLHHLISNAISSTTGGLVRVDVSVFDTTRIQFRVSDSGDSGGNVAAFLDPFSSDNRRLSDADVRLSIARQIVDLMDGSFGYETSDRGSAIWFDVLFGPARRANDRPQGPKPDPASPPAVAHVLVVDDSEVNRLLATSQLERLGHTFATAEGGREAIELLQSDAFDLVLMDWHMPEMDGLAATRTWRTEHDPDHNLPIITMTASAMAGDRERCLEAGASDYLSKPVSISELGAMITRWTQMSATEDTALQNTTAENTAGEQPPEVDPTDDPLANEAAPSYDQSQVSALITDLGDLDVVRSIVQAFLDMVPQYRATAEEAIVEGDRATIRRCAHTLKSTALMLGTDELAEVCIMLEAAAARTDGGDLTAHVAEFARCCHRAEVTLAELSEQLDSDDRFAR